MTTKTKAYLSEIEGSEVPSVPAGRYLARLDGVESATTKYGLALKWHWIIADPADGTDFEVSQMTSTATSGGSKAGGILKALLGRTLAAHEKLPTAQLAGQVAVLDLIVDNESGWNRIDAVYPAPRPPQPAPPPVAAAAQPAAAPLPAPAELSVALDELPF